MKKYLAGLVSVFALVVLVATPALALTPEAEQAIKDASSGGFKQPPAKSAIEVCKKQKREVIKFEPELRQFAKNHYILPGPPQGNKLSAYDKDYAKFIDGSVGILYKASAKVPVYRDGDLKQKSFDYKVNYAMVLQRHQAARKVAATKPSLKASDLYKSYDAAAISLKQAINDGQLFINSTIASWNKDQPTVIDCQTNAGIAKAKELTKSRSTYLNLLSNTFIAPAKKSDTKLKGLYPKVSDTYAKKAAATKATKAKKTAAAKAAEAKERQEIKLCTNNKALFIDKFSSELDQFEKDYLKPPTAFELSGKGAYKPTTIVDIEGKKVKAFEPVHRVLINDFKTGKVKRENRTNYGLVHQRYRAALDVIKAATGSPDFQTKRTRYASDVSNLRKATDGVNLAAIRLQWGQAKSIAGGINCSSATGQQNAKSLMRTREAIYNKDLKPSGSILKEAEKAKKAVEESYKIVYPAYTNRSR